MTERVRADPEPARHLSLTETQVDPAPANVVTKMQQLLRIRSIQLSGAEPDATGQRRPPEALPGSRGSPAFVGRRARDERGYLWTACIARARSRFCSTTVQSRLLKKASMYLARARPKSIQ
jgi:hypothetical protein